MSDDFEILETRVAAPVARPRPRGREYRVFRGAGGFEALVHRDVFHHIQGEGRSTSDEIIGRLAGATFRDAKGVYTVIVGAARCRALEGRLAVTAPALANVQAMEILDFRFGGWEPKGWYHTHPRIGAFYSGTDRKTQSKIGGDDLGIVVDPYSAGSDSIEVFRGPRSERLAPSIARIESPAASRFQQRRAAASPVPASRSGGFSMLACFLGAFLAWALILPASPAAPCATCAQRARAGKAAPAILEGSGERDVNVLEGALRKAGVHGTR